MPLGIIYLLTNLLLFACLPDCVSFLFANWCGGSDSGESTRWVCWGWYCTALPPSPGHGGGGRGAAGEAQPRQHQPGAEEGTAGGAAPGGTAPAAGDEAADAAWYVTPTVTVAFLDQGKTNRYDNIAQEL